MYPIKDSWITYKYNIGSTRVTPHQYLEIDFNNAELYKPNLRKAIDDDLLDISKKADSIGVFYSGGVDSEVILISLKALGIPFRCFFINFANDLNAHEREYASAFCKENNIELETIDLDFYHWLDNEAVKYTEEFNLSDLSMPLQFWARDQLPHDITIIAGNGDPKLTKHHGNPFSNRVSWHYTISESSDIASIDFVKTRGYPDVPVFFKYSSELTLSYLLQPKILELVSTDNYKNTIISSKFEILSRYYDLTTRPKYTGFENLKSDTLKILSKKATNSLKYIETNTYTYKEMVNRICGKITLPPEITSKINASIVE